MTPTQNASYDAIVVGSGAAGGTLARELAIRGQRVLVLEKGKGEPDPDSRVAPNGKTDLVFVGRGIPVARGIGVGGSTLLFFYTDFSGGKETADLGGSRRGVTLGLGIAGRF